MGEGVRAYRCGYDLHRPGDMEIGKIQNRDRQSLLKEEPAVLVSVDRVFCHGGPTCEKHNLEDMGRSALVGDILRRRHHAWQAQRLAVGISLQCGKELLGHGEEEMGVRGSRLVAVVSGAGEYGGRTEGCRRGAAEGAVERKGAEEAGGDRGKLVAERIQQERRDEVYHPGDERREGDGERRDDGRQQVLLYVRAERYATDAAEALHHEPLRAA